MSLKCFLIKFKHLFSMRLILYFVKLMASSVGMVGGMSPHHMDKKYVLEWKHMNSFYFLCISMQLHSNVCMHAPNIVCT